MQPTYQSGFYAPGRGTALHPELWRGCVGAWNPGLGNSGLVLRDWSGNQNNGVLTNGPTWGVSDGRQALTLDGVGDYVQPVKPINRLTGQATITSVVYPTGLTVGKLGGIVKSTTNSPTAGDFILYVNNTTFGMATWGTTAKRTESTVAISNNNRWALSATYNAATDVVRLFINGTAVSTTTGSSFGSGWLTEYMIGRAYPGTSYCWAGSIMQVDLYDRVLADSVVRTLAQRPGIAYELARRKTYFIQAATSTSQFYDVLSPLIFAGTN